MRYSLNHFGITSATMMRILLILAYSIIFLPIYVGFLMGLIGPPFSLAYTLFVITLGIIFIISPFFIYYYRKIYGTKIVVFSLLPLTCLILLGYIFFSFKYYYTQAHFFDPFLQVQPIRIDIVEKPDNTIRILAMGGSTTKNSRVPKDKRYTTVLQTLLQNEYPSKNIEVFNAGQDMYSTKHTLINYVTNMREWHPDIVIIMHGINDLFRSFSDFRWAVGKYDRLYSHFYAASINGAKPPPFEKKVLAPFLTRWYWRYQYIEENVPLDRYVSLKDFKRNLRILTDFLKNDDVRTILMTQGHVIKDNFDPNSPSLWFAKEFCKEKKNWFQSTIPSSKSMRIAMDAFNCATKEIAKQENVLFVDMEKEIPKNKDYFVDDVHYTERGTTKIAEVLFRKIINERLAERIALSEQEKN